MVRRTDDDSETVRRLGVAISSPSKADSTELVVRYEPEVRGVRVGVSIPESSVAEDRMSCFSGL